MKEATKKEILIGLLIGLGIGVPALVLALLLARPGVTPPPETATPTAQLLTEPLPLPTSTPAADVPVELEASPLPEDELPTATATLTPTRVITHTVAAGETLGAIALEYGVSLADLIAANEIENPDFISQGEVLTITVEASDEDELGAAEPALSPFLVATPPTVTLELLAADYPAILSGNLPEVYPEVVATDRFDIHYAPGTYVEADLDNVTAMLERGLEHIETLLEAEILTSFDVYVAGSPFAPPDQLLRGRSFSAARRTFFLHDGTGNPADQQYISIHEVTHLFAWNVFGRPVSAMLSEGAAVYTGMTAIEASDHISHQAFCRAYQEADRLPRVSTTLRYEHPVRDLDNYYAAGCFVQYLIETYGADRFADLYSTGHYSDVYGKSLSALETEWRAALEEVDVESDLDPDALREATEALATAYDELFADFGGEEEDWQAYLELDAARIALLEGRFDDVDAHLEALDL